MEDTPIDQLVIQYVHMRTAIEDKKAEQEAELLKLQEPFEELAARLLAHCNAQNIDSLRTPGGTVSRRVSERFWTNDWERMYAFVLEHEIPQVLERRIHNGNMKQFLEENPDSFPMGMQADRKYVISVRKPNAK